MQNKIIISSTCLISILGSFVVAYNNPIFLTGYALLTTILFAIVTVGGIIDYNRLEARDIREVHRERAKIAKEKNAHLTELLVEKENEIKKLRGNKCRNQTTANREPSSTTGIAIEF
jgi:hypothetical protein